MYYEEPQQINKPIGNNALSYKERKDLGSSCILTIPSLKQGNFDDIQIGSDIVFEEIDHKGILQSCIGLKNIIALDPNCTLQIAHGKIFIMDNHNHALYLRYREHLANHFNAGMILIHIDQHADMGAPITAIDKSRCSDINYIASYTNEVCNVGNFIQPALDSGLISEVIQIRSVSKLLDTNPESLIPNPYILDIDIDFRVDHTPTKEEIASVHALLQGASMCTIALSPYFMPLEKSIEVTKILFS